MMPRCACDVLRLSRLCFCLMLKLPALCVQGGGAGADPRAQGAEGDGRLLRWVPLCPGSQSVAPACSHDSTSYAAGAAHKHWLSPRPNIPYPLSPHPQAMTSRAPPPTHARRCSGERDSASAAEGCLPCSPAATPMAGMAPPHEPLCRLRASPA